MTPAPPIASFRTERDAAVEKWVLAPHSMLPISARQCLVRSRVTPAAAVLTSEVFGLLPYCTGCKPLAAHADAIVAAVPALAGQRPAVLSALEGLGASGLLLRDSVLLQNLSTAVDDREPSPLWGVIIRTCDRPDLLRRLVQSLADNERDYGNRYDYHVLDDSRDTANRARNSQIIAAQTKLSARYQNLADGLPLRAKLDAEFPQFRAEIAWVLGEAEAADAATYGRPLNYALLMSAGERLVTIDDDAILDARYAPRFEAGLEISGERDDWDFFGSEAEIMAEAKPVGVDPIADHARWLGRKAGAVVASNEPLPDDWARGLIAEDLLRVRPDSTVLFTQNGVYGDPGSSLYPMHLFELDGEAYTRFTGDPAEYRRHLRTRHNWRGRSRLRIASRRTLTLTTLAGCDNRALLPPTIPSLRNEDLLLGEVAQLAHPTAVQLDLPWGLLHFRLPPKEWNALSDALPFRQQAPHFILEQVAHIAAHCQAASPQARLRLLAATLRDLSEASDVLLRTRLEDHLLDTRARHRFALERALVERPNAPSYWHRDVDALLRHRSLSLAAEDVVPALADVSEVRTILASYARALNAWCEIWAYCRVART